jgi:hypothetical protein
MIHNWPDSKELGAQRVTLDVALGKRLDAAKGVSAGSWSTCIPEHAL